MKNKSLHNNSLSEEANKMLAQWLEIRQDLENRKEKLSGKDLSHLKLMEADLSNAVLAGADLTSTYLIRANLENADLSEADLSNTVFAEANLRGANFNDAEMEDTWLNGADLSGVLNLTADQVQDAHFDRDTRFPDNIRITWGEDGRPSVAANG